MRPARQRSAAMTALRSALGPMVALVLCWLVLAGAAVAGRVTVFAVATAAVYVLEFTFWRRQLALDGTLARLDGGADLRLLTLVALLLVAAARSARFSPWTLAILGVLLLAGYLLLVPYLAARGSEYDRARLQWVNLDVLPPPGQTAGVHVPLCLDGLAVLGVLAGRWGAGTIGPLAGAGALVVAAAVLPRVVPAWFPNLRGSTFADQTRDALTAALARRGPEVAVHFAGPAGSTYALSTWIPTLQGLSQAPLVIVREPRHLPAVANTDLPAVCLPAGSDIEDCLPDSVRLALYPVNVSRNNHMFRLVGIRDVFIGHGDSDKDTDIGALVRLYDEVWLAGPAARDRYRRTGIELADDHIRMVGRPQLAQIDPAGQPDEPDKPARPGARVPAPPLRTVLYAPTWEGAVHAADHSSVPEMGTRIIDLVAALPDTRLVFAPHPATGSVQRRHRRAVTDLTARVHALAGPHQVVRGPAALAAALRHADVVITDICAVLTDAVGAGRRCLVTDPEGLPADEFVERYPSARAGAVFGPDCARLSELVLAPPAAPAALAAYLVAGTPGADPAAGFRAGVTAALAATPTRTPVRA